MILILPSQIGITIENQRINVDYETLSHAQFVGDTSDNLLNIDWSLRCYMETYSGSLWDYMKKHPDHCKVKVETHWKGKHCKPFYQTGRW